MTDPERPRRCRVLLVREWERQMSSSGCCGRLEGDFLGRPAGSGSTEARTFPGRRREMERAGRLYRALRERYGARVEIHVVDPRNLPALVPMVVADAMRHGRSLRETLRSFLRWSVTMVVVNGRVVASGRWPGEDEVFRAVEETAAPPPGEASGAGSPYLARAIPSPATRPHRRNPCSTCRSAPPSLA